MPANLPPHTSPETPGKPAEIPLPPGVGPFTRRLEAAIQGALFLAAGLSVLTTIGIVVMLVRESFGFFVAVNPLEFLFGLRWTPLLEPKSFGVIPLVVGTMHIVVGSAIIALPAGLCIGIYLSEYASERTRSIVKPLLEILAGIPTVVYGYFALTAITPAMQWVALKLSLPEVNIFNSFSAAFVVGIMTLPTVASLCEDAFHAVPKSLRQGAYALGATPFEVAMRVVVPSALSGVLAAFILAVSRAIGETMAVTLAAGATPNLTLNPFESIQTMTAFIVQVSLGDTPHGSIEYQTIFAVGLLLFLITLVLNVAAHRIMERFREVYE